MQMRYPAILSALGVPLLLCGCTVGPDYRAPSISIEESFDVATTQPSPATRPAPDSGATVVSTSPMVAAQWWQTLHDPQLDALMNRAVTSNIDVRIAGARVRQARAELAYAAGGQYPHAELN